MMIAAMVNIAIGCALYCRKGRDGFSKTDGPLAGNCLSGRAAINPSCVKAHAPF